MSIATRTQYVLDTYATVEEAVDALDKEQRRQASGAVEPFAFLPAESK